MNILLTNDDGYLADGINLLYKLLTAKGHNVFIVSPEKEKSGASHSITFNDAIRVTNPEPHLWIISGSPVDCIQYSLLGILDIKPDLIISGVNHGPNIGKDIIYSGTFAAARHGCMNNIPSMALSSQIKDFSINHELITHFINVFFDSMIKKTSTEYVLNINIPDCTSENCKGLKNTILADHHFFEDSIVKFDSPYQGTYYWLKGKFLTKPKDVETDYGAIHHGFISTTAVRVLFSEVALII